MKILLDENLPIKLKYKISGDHNVYTTHEMKWSGKKNGELLHLLGENEFDILITADKNIKSQQNLSVVKIIIIVLNSPNNRFSTLLPFIDELNRILKSKISQKIIDISL
jgi:hypothetical protein